MSFLCLALCLVAPGLDEKPFAPVKIPDWVFGTTRMAFLTPGQVNEAADAGVQVVHTNVIWPYYPLRRDGGGLSKTDAANLKALVDACHARGMKLVLGLPPFPSVELVRAHPDWRVDPDGSGKAFTVEPREDDLGSRIGSNLGPWGDYLINLLVELVEDYKLDGYSFDGNYHPPIDFQPQAVAYYRRETGREMPRKVNLDDLDYRRYLVWRGEKLEDHYRTMQARLKAVNPDCVVMSWSTNGGRYGHFLTSPRVMTTRTNLLFDLPMQEWWLDETNFGASVAPAFGAAYLRATTDGRPSASEPYLLSRGNPYGSDSFPKHERIVRAMLVVTQGAVSAHSFGFPGHGPSTKAVFEQIRTRDEWTRNARPIPWAAMLVSEQTRQFVAYGDIAERFLPHVFGGFRALTEEHRPFDLVNDWNLTPEKLAPYRVLFLPNASAISDDAAKAIRSYVEAGGGLVATGETSICDELGVPRKDFALADLFGVSYRGIPRDAPRRETLDANFAITVDEAYWRDRVGLARLSWEGRGFTADPRLEDLVPMRSAIFRGPQVLVTEPKEASEVLARRKPESGPGVASPAIVARTHGKGRGVYFAAGIDAALWSYSYPYQRRLLVQALDWAAGTPAPIAVDAPMAVQASFFEQPARDRHPRRLVVHLFNGVVTNAHHGLPRNEVPLREESIPIHDIRVRYRGKDLPRAFRVEPGARAVKVENLQGETVVTVPPLEIHQMLVGEWD